MKFRRLHTFRDDFAKLPTEIQEQAKEKFRLFQQDPAHNSLRIKKMQGQDNIWEGHVTRGYVFTFMWMNDPETGEPIAVFRRIGTHSIYDKP
jgi:hypothetical protein